MFKFEKEICFLGSNSGQGFNRYFLYILKILQSFFCSWPAMRYEFNSSPGIFYPLFIKSFLSYRVYDSNPVNKYCPMWYFWLIIWSSTCPSLSFLIFCSRSFINSYFSPLYLYSYVRPSSYSWRLVDYSFSSCFLIYLSHSICSNFFL